MPAAPELLLITTSELQLQKNNALVEKRQGSKKSTES